MDLKKIAEETFARQAAERKQRQELRESQRQKREGDLRKIIAWAETELIPTLQKGVDQLKSINIDAAIHQSSSSDTSMGGATELLTEVVFRIKSSRLRFYWGYGASHIAVEQGDVHGHPSKTKTADYTEFQAIEVMLLLEGFTRLALNQKDEDGAQPGVTDNDHSWRGACAARHVPAVVIV